MASLILGNHYCKVSSLTFQITKNTYTRGFRPATLLKSRLWRRCFPVKKHSVQCINLKCQLPNVRVNFLPFFINVRTSEFETLYKTGVYKNVFSSEFLVVAHIVHSLLNTKKLVKFSFINVLVFACLSNIFFERICALNVVLWSQ